MWVCAKHDLTVAKLLDLPDAGAQLLMDEYKEIGTAILTTGCDAAWEFIDAMGGESDMNTIASEITKRPLSDISEIDAFDVNEVIAKMRSRHYYQRTLVQAAAMRKLAGDEYLIGGGYFGPFTMAAQILGVEDFMMALFDDEDGYVQKLLDFAYEISCAYFEDLIAAGIDLITVPEPIASGDLISREQFDEFVLPIDVKLKNHLESKCPNFFIHICGKTGHLVEPMGEARYGIFSVDSIDMVEAQKNAGGRVALFGNLNPVSVLCNKSAGEVYEISKQLCAEMKPYGGFILAPGCDLAPAIPLENLQAMAKAALEV